MSLVFEKIILVKEVYNCYFCQLALLNIFLSVETASDSQCNSFFSSLIANMATILINFQQKTALVRILQHFAIKFLNQKNFSHAQKALQDPFYLLELLSAIAQSKLRCV